MQAFIKPGTCFFKIAFVQEVGMCVFPLPRLLKSRDVIWHDMDLIWLVKQLLQLLYGSYSQYH